MFCALLTQRLTSPSLVDAEKGWEKRAKAEYGIESIDSNCIDIAQRSESNDKNDDNDDDATANASASGEHNSASITSTAICSESNCSPGQMCLHNQDCSWNDCSSHRCVPTCTIGILPLLYTL